MFPESQFHCLYNVIDVKKLKGFKFPEYRGITELLLSVVPEWNGVEITEADAHIIEDKFYQIKWELGLPLLSQIELQCKVNITAYCHYDKFGNALQDSTVWAEFIGVFVVPEYLNGIPTFPPDYISVQCKGTPRWIPEEP